MSQPPDKDTLALAGLAAANGPWLAARLARLAELAGLALPDGLAATAVAEAARVFAEVLRGGGRLSPGGEDADPAVQLGRGQAARHQQAGLDLPQSLKAQRLLRRAFDDLVRESWVEKDSRARAHEDVERFFERALIGLALAWTGYEPPRADAPDPALAALVALREDELRRALDGGRRLKELLRQARERADSAQAALAEALRREQELSRRVAESEAACAVPAGEPPPVALKNSPDAPAAGPDDAEGLRAELRALREAHAALASEAEAMRLRLVETGSRAAEQRRAEEKGAESRAESLAARLREAEAELARLRGQG